ncbi:hypothetical protein CEXT_102221 [Caerostris extrusa]|uniref:Uncharacterized protein n=1 Tax=Caerostris extrusa TaxID=172846 RepID=A0AAV4UZI1_CAEEX|nr:hypothetical protein CEXT_102221 [Caerostris extrusa]
MDLKTQQSEVSRLSSVEITKQVQQTSKNPNISNLCTPSNTKFSQPKLLVSEVQPHFVTSIPIQPLYTTVDCTIPYQALYPSSIPPISSQSFNTLNAKNNNFNKSSKELIYSNSDCFATDFSLTLNSAQILKTSYCDPIYVDARHIENCIQVC